MTKRFWNGLLLAALAMGLCGFQMPKFFNKEPKAAPPKLLVLPFRCPDALIGEDITKGFIASIDTKIDVKSIADYELVLSSYSYNLAQVAEASGLEIADSTGPAKFEPFIKKLFRSSAAAKKFYEVTSIEYVAAGKAKEKPLGELELNNLKTAQTADVQLLSTRDGEILVENFFKQGRFEIVAPDRIGAKLAAAVNEKFKEMRKDAERRAKEESARQ